VFWGGLGKPAEAVEDVLPYPSWLSDMKREIAGETRPGCFPSVGGATARSRAAQ
jgi:hypothetical protein